MLFSANESGAVGADISLQNQADLSADCKTHCKHALGFRVRIITVAINCFFSSFIYLF